MIKINLLPPEAIEKEAKRNIIVLIIVSGIGVVCLAVIFLIVRIIYDKKLASEINLIDKELTKYQQTVDEVRKLKEMTDMLEAKRKLIEQLMKGRLFYPKFMENVLKVLPPTLWITSLNTTSQPDGLLVDISLSAFDNFGIADFISNLEENKNKFTNIELGAIGTGTSGTREVLLFQIKFKYLFGED
jgi:Tfp pilus assembly protein PilN